MQYFVGVTPTMHGAEMSSTTDTNTQWFYEVNGKRSDATAYEDIVTLISSEKISGKNLVWNSTMRDWMPLESTELRAHLVTRKTPPPLTGNAVNNSTVWTLAFAPVISLFIESIIAFSVYDTEFMATQSIAAGEYFWVAIIINIALSFRDEKKLREAGHDTSNFKGMAFFVPVYLFKRAKALQQSPSYFWTWIGLFVITAIR